jgi:hypothetical protein
MIKLILLSILCVSTWYYFPETRAMLLDAAEPVVAPIFRWSAHEEMAQIGRNAVDQERLTGQLPGGSAWLDWLAYRYATDEAREDSWGSTYQLEILQDSVAVVSFGPDRTRGTDDDFRVLTARD